MIEAKVEKGVYDRPSLFDADVNQLFANAIEFYGSESPERTTIIQLQTIYARKKAYLYGFQSVELRALLESQHVPCWCPVEDSNEICLTVSRMTNKLYCFSPISLVIFAITILFAYRIQKIPWKIRTNQ